MPVTPSGNSLVHSEESTGHTNAMDEFNTLRSACGVYDLGDRAKVVLTGSDRVRWLTAGDPVTMTA